MKCRGVLCLHCLQTRNRLFKTPPAARITRERPIDGVHLWTMSRPAEKKSGEKRTRPCPQAGIVSMPIDRNYRLARRRMALARRIAVQGSLLLAGRNHAQALSPMLDFILPSSDGTLPRARNGMSRRYLRLGWTGMLLISKSRLLDIIDLLDLMNHFLWLVSLPIFHRECYRQQAHCYRHR